MTEKKKPVGFYNPSLNKVLPSSNDSLMEVFTKSINDLEEGQKFSMYESVGNRVQKFIWNLGGQLRLNAKNRGGRNLWEPIFSEEEFDELYRKTMGVDKDGKRIQPGQESKSKSKTKSKSKKANSESNKEELGSDLQEALA